jgi:serine protease
MKTGSLIRARSVTFTCVLTIGSAAAATVIHVPADQPTIQAGINAAVSGDTVLVSPGAYKENINFNGKAITVTSSSGAKVTIIAVEPASPTIKGNIIQNNKGSNGGGGIGVGFSSPLIQGNIIRNNTQSVGVTGGIGGGGISVVGASSAQIVGNVIQNNSWPSSSGGGISLWAAGAVLIKDNLFTGNTCYGSGTAIEMANDVSGTVIVQNVFTGNNSSNSSSVFWSNPPAALVNNTMTDGPSSTPGFSVVSSMGLSSSMVFANNNIAATNVGTTAFYCAFSGISNPLNFYNNNIFSKQGAAYGGACTDQTGSNHNISASPQFVSSGNLGLKAGSPAIDAGNNSAPYLPSTDFAGNSRIVNGNGGSTATIDMGAYEFLPVTLTPKTLNFGAQAVGSTTTKTVTLTNAQNKALNISSETAPTGYKVSGCGTSVAAFSSCSLTVTFHPLTTGSFKGTLTAKDDAGNSPQTVSLSGSAH